MKYYYADQNCLKILRVIIMILMIFIIAIISYFLAFIPIVMIILSSIFFIAGFFIAFIYLPVYFKNMKYYVSDEQIIKISGFYFIKKQAINISKIQYTTTISTPLSKNMKFNFIFLYVYGGMMPVMFINDHDFMEITYNLKV